MLFRSTLLHDYTCICTTWIDFEPHTTLHAHPYLPWQRSNFCSVFCSFILFRSISSFLLFVLHTFILLYHFVMDLKLYNRLIVIRDDLHDIEIPNVFFLFVCGFRGTGTKSNQGLYAIFLHSCIHVICRPVSQSVSQSVSHMKQKEGRKHK